MVFTFNFCICAQVEGLEFEELLSPVARTQHLCNRESVRGTARLVEGWSVKGKKTNKTKQKASKQVKKSPDLTPKNQTLQNILYVDKSVWLLKKNRLFILQI